MQRVRKGKKRDNKSAVNESQPALQTHKQLSWRVTEFLQTRTEQGCKGEGGEEEKRKKEGVLINKTAFLDDPRYSSPPYLCGLTNF